MEHRTPSLEVFRRDGSTDRYYGSIRFGAIHYPMQRDSALSRMFFRVRHCNRDPTSPMGRHPGNLTFWQDPATYFSATFPPPQPPAQDADGSSMERYNEAIQTWIKHRDTFDASHADFYALRDDIVQSPGKYAAPL